MALGYLEQDTIFAYTNVVKMQFTHDILKYAHRGGIEPSMDLLYHKEQQIPGSVNYNINRYFAQHEWVAENVGMFIYNFNPTKPEENSIELRFCVIGNKYCFDKSCSACKDQPTDCNGKQTTVDVFNFFFSSIFLYQFTHNSKLTNKKDEVLAFRHEESFTKIFSLCNKKKNNLDSILNHSYTGAMENIFINSKIQDLLLHSMDCLVEERLEKFTCKFLEDDRTREGIYKVREILLQHIGDPITIKALSRKVALNECYVKQGFKELFGVTIFDFFQQQRMEHAKYLLHEKGLSVTDVSAALGYSSISHFSAAFKKHTGIKPCELLK